MPSAKKLVAHECNPKKRIADVQAYTQGVKRATEFPLRAKRTADGQAYAQGVKRETDFLSLQTKRTSDCLSSAIGLKRATGSVSAFYKYMKENPQRALGLMSREVHQGCAFLDSSLAALVQNDRGNGITSAL